MGLEAEGAVHPAFESVLHHEGETVTLLDDSGNYNTR
jgi:hypothetical protein